MSMLRRRPSLVLVVLGLGLTAGACKGDPPTPKLFDEEGAWSLVRYDIEGSGDLKEIDVNNRRDAFLLSFDSHEKVVTSAACVETENDTPASSSCLLTPGTTDWFCHCYAYDFVREQMLWQEFDAGDIPPDVSLADLDEADGGEATAGETGGGGGEATDQTLIELAEIMGVSSTYNFRPLPLGLFGSDGETSRFVFQIRADSVFDRVYDDPDGRQGCEPCI